MFKVSAFFYKRFKTRFLVRTCMYMQVLHMLGLPQCENLWTFSCFVAIVRVRVYYVDFFVFFVLRHWWVSQVLTPRQSPYFKMLKHVSLYAKQFLLVGCGQLSLLLMLKTHSTVQRGSIFTLQWCSLVYVVYSVIWSFQRCMFTWFLFLYLTCILYQLIFIN